MAAVWVTGPKRTNSGPAQDLIDTLLAHADIEVGGARGWDIQVHGARLHERVLAHGALGLGEAFMDG